MCINNISEDPYFNLALEEYLLKNYSDDIFMLWQNEPSIVVGKHQNTLAEINHQFILDNHIKVARRLSGGGTVYQDDGNLNFTYIMNGKEGKLVNFIKYTNDILEVLNNLGVPAERNQRNDLTIEGKKVSGNAEHIFKNRIIHHGTLLFNSDLNKLDIAIKVEKGKYEDKSVQSVRSRVTNISPYLTKNINVDQFKNIIFDFVLNNYSNAELHDLKLDEYQFVTKLKVEKYETWDWIYGYSPKFKVKRAHNFPKGNLNIELLIKKGLIDEVNLKGKLFNKEERSRFSEILLGLRYEKEEINQAFLKVQLNLSNNQFLNDEIINLFF